MTDSTSKTSGPTDSVEPADPAESAEAAGPDETATAEATTAGVTEPAEQQTVVIELTQTQVQNDPLLAASDEVLADVQQKLRWATAAYAVIGWLTAWGFAALIAVGTGNVSALAWAAGASILVSAGGVWYLVEVLSAFDDADAYLRSKSPAALARLGRVTVVGLTWRLGLWIGWMLIALAFASGALALTLALAGGAGGWLWLIAVLPVLIAYLAWFALLQYRLVEHARDALA